MTLNAKIDPPLVASAEGVLRINARPYNQDAITPGAEIFVWTTQRTGGHRLAARGTVIGSRIENLPNASGQGTHKELVVDIQTTGAGPLRPLATDQIPTLHEAPAPSDARQMYSHALNKITSLDADVADQVRSHFEDL